MSLRAMLWAYDQEIFPASNKFVLITLANFCGDAGKSYPSIGSLHRATSLQEETIRKAIGKLIEQGFIKDSGETVGATGRVKVYQFPDSVSEIPLKTGGLKRRNTPVNTNGNTPANTPVFRSCLIEGTVTGNRNGETEFVLASDSKPSKPKGRATLEEAKSFSKEIGLPESDGESFYWGKEGNGWKNVKDWKATMRNWKLQGWMASQKQPGKTFKRNNEENDGVDF